MNKQKFEILNNVDVSLLFQSDLMSVLHKLSLPHVAQRVALC